MITTLLELAPPSTSRPLQPDNQDHVHYILVEPSALNDPTAGSSDFFFPAFDLERTLVSRILNHNMKTIRVTD